MRVLDFTLPFFLPFLLLATRLEFVCAAYFPFYTPDRRIHSSPYLKGLVMDMESIKSMYHFAEDELIDSWMYIVGKCF